MRDRRGRAREVSYAITALRERDIARAKAAFDTYDSGWNGIEVYINTRGKSIYQLLELVLVRLVQRVQTLVRPNPGSGRPKRRIFRPAA